LLSKALADDVEVDESALENDPELLAELSGLIGSSEEETPAVPDAPPPRLPQSGVQDTALISKLRGLMDVYEKMLTASTKEGNTAKQKRHQRTVDRLKELIVKAERGESIDESEIPPAPPSFAAPPLPAHRAPAPPSPPASQPPPVPRRRSTSGAAPPPLPKRMSSTSLPPESPVGVSSRHGGPAHIKQLRFSKRMPIQERTALDTATADELDLADVPPSPPPYRKAEAEKPATFIGGLQSRMERFQALAKKAAQDGNDRKARMNNRMADQYAAAIRDAKAGRPVAVADLPSLPDMPPLPPQKPAAPIGPAPGMRPPPATGPLAPSGQPGKSRNATQLEFLIKRQSEFRHAAMQAKARGNMDFLLQVSRESKRSFYLLQGFDKMIAAAQSGLPVSIKSTPIPPQASTSQATLQPRIVPGAASTTGIEGRGEALSMMEKALIEQVQLAENSRMRFTRLGDVGKVKMFEEWAKASKQDLLLVREVAKQGLNLPKSAFFSHLFTVFIFIEIFEYIFRDVPLPSGYEPSDANLFVKYTFPYPSDANQSGKTKYVSGTQHPEFGEVCVLQIGTRKSRGLKLMRVLKRIPLKLEVYQKGSFLRSDKLLGTCEWKLDHLESNALLEESLPLKEGRKAVGGLLTLKIRIREPLGDAKVSATQHRWMVLDN
uniref:C2 domain-containing protein n=1 Tax=Haemonchus placei TaxID=6290 RepID=A0A0N4WKJ5_HAEPC